VKYIWEGNQYDLIQNYSEMLSQMDGKLQHLVELSLNRTTDFKRMCYKTKKFFEYLEKLGTQPKNQLDFANYLKLGIGNKGIRQLTVI
jgi:hypothetical protein